MTEAEWLTATSPMAMLEFLGNCATEGKLRLFAIACCRLSWDTILNGELRRGIELAEELVEGRSAESERAAAELAILDLFEQELEKQDEYDPTPIRDVLRLLSPARYLSVNAARCSASVAHWALGGDIYTNYRDFEADLVADHATFVRDIFGPSAFRHVDVDRRWLTSDVLALAAGIYTHRAFDWMPILADALQDAGCDNGEILDHCRQPGEHVRGCWVVDLVLGKK